MLKITIHDAPETLTFQLEGRLIGAWARELEQSWMTARSVVGRKSVIVDLTGATFIDNEGKRVLARLFHEGARFKASAPLTRCIVGEITGEAAPRSSTSVLMQALAALLAIGIAQATATAAVEPSPIRLTLKEALQLSLRQNPDVQIANLNIAESVQNQAIARSSLLPQIGLSASDTLRRGNTEAQLGQRIPFLPGHVGPFSVIQAGPVFSAPVFDLTAWRRWQASKENVKGSESQQFTVREQNVLLVVSQYLGSMRAAADVKAAQSRSDLAKALYELASDLQKNGAGTRIDTLRANVQYQNEKQRLIIAQTQLKTSLYGLARLLNIDPHQPIELADESEFFETPNFSSDDTIERAWTERPEMKALAAQMRSTGYEMKAARDSRLPTLNLLGGWSLQGISPTTSIPAYQYEASLNVPLFTGGRIKAQTAIAGIELRKLAQKEQELRNRIALEVKTAGAQIESARTEVDVSNLAVDLAQQELEQARDRFEAGVANNIEVVTAQDELSRAHDNQIAALYRYNQARADLAHATGQIETVYSK
jgi:outer membrane protein TolC